MSATHGAAHLALYDQQMWDKYKPRTSPTAPSKPTFSLHRANTRRATSTILKTRRAFGPSGNTIPALQERGVVFMACHNAIWEVTEKLLAKGVNPDGLSREGDRRRIDEPPDRRRGAYAWYCRYARGAAAGRLPLRRLTAMAAAVCRAVGFVGVLLVAWVLLTSAGKVLARDDVFPPWHGENSHALKRGLEFTVPEADDLADFHGDITNPQLVLFVGGNYFFAMAPLVDEFEREDPSTKADYTGRRFLRPACQTDAGKRYRHFGKYDLDRQA